MMSIEVSPTERLERLRKQLSDLSPTAAEAVGADARTAAPTNADQLTDCADPRSFSDWSQWGQFRQQQ